MLSVLLLSFASAVSTTTAKPKPQQQQLQDGSTTQQALPTGFKTAADLESFLKSIGAHTTVGGDYARNHSQLKVVQLRAAKEIKVLSDELAVLRAQPKVDPKEITDLQDRLTLISDDAARLREAHLKSNEELEAHKRALEAHKRASEDLLNGLEASGYKEKGLHGFLAAHPLYKHRAANFEVKVDPAKLEEAREKAQGAVDAFNNTVSDANYQRFLKVKGDLPETASEDDIKEALEADGVDVGDVEKAYQDAVTAAGNLKNLVKEMEIQLKAYHDLNGSTDGINNIPSPPVQGAVTQ